MKTLMFVLTLLVGSLSFADEPLTVRLESASVMIRAGNSSGSGVIFNRDDETFAWTAGHVVDGLRSERKVIVDGVSKTIVEFSDPYVVQVLKQDGREIGELKLAARLLKYSDADHGEDLALLHVRKKGHFHDSVEFYLDDAIPAIGSDLYHVGSLLGSVGSNSLTTGIISQHGRLIGDKVYDQTTATAFPGSSGGGIFLRSDGKYVGMLVRGAGEGFNLMVPVRRMHAYCQAEGIEWAMDAKEKMPALDEVFKLPIE